MKIALIPPTGYEYLASASDFHMVLAPELRRPEYSSMYSKIVSEGTNYVIMDNGANEGYETTSTWLGQTFNNLKPNELVLPDALGETTRTIVRMTGYLIWHQQAGLDKTNFMGVLQGRNKDEIDYILEWLAAKPEVTTLGIPRHLVSTLNASYSLRLDLATSIEEKYPRRFEVHLLGAIPEWPTEIRAAAKYVPFIRSMDSSLPFYYAMAGIRLDNVKQTIKRPKGYFNDFIDMDPRLAEYNVQTLLGWVNG